LNARLLPHWPHLEPVHQQSTQEHARMMTRMDADSRLEDHSNPVFSFKSAFKRRNIHRAGSPCRGLLEELCLPSSSLVALQCFDSCHSQPHSSDQEIVSESTPPRTRAPYAQTSFDELQAEGYETLSRAKQTKKKKTPGTFTASPPSPPPLLEAPLPQAPRRPATHEGSSFQGSRGFQGRSKALRGVSGQLGNN